MHHKTTSSQALALFAAKPVAKPEKTPRTADVSEIVEAEHEKYRIRAGRLGGTHVARAFPKPPSRAQGLIAEAEGDSEQAAIMALKAKIEVRALRRMETRRWDENSSLAVPNEEEFVEALYQTPLSRPQIAMLKAHSFAHEKGLTFDQLARAAGYKSRETAIKVFCKAGDLLADYLGIEVDQETFPDREGAALVLAFKYIQGEDVPTVWIMHPELRDAVQTALK